MIPPRAALPMNVDNYVTPNGLAELKIEYRALEESRQQVSAENETEKRRTQALIDGKIKLLMERIQTARVLNPEDQPQDEVRFGATVKLENKTDGKIQEFQIVGVDEADIKKKKIAFVAPIAKAVNGKKVGEEIDFNLGKETRKLKILQIDY